jgi:hypothetical protein
MVEGWFGSGLNVAFCFRVIGVPFDNDTTLQNRMLQGAPDKRGDRR